jgi:hypothetical protein
MSDNGLILSQSHKEKARLAKHEMELIRLIRANALQEKLLKAAEAVRAALAAEVHCRLSQVLPTLDNTPTIANLQAQIDALPP